MCTTWIQKGQTINLSTGQVCCLLSHSWIQAAQNACSHSGASRGSWRIFAIVYNFQSVGWAISLNNCHIYSATRKSISRHNHNQANVRDIKVPPAQLSRSDISILHPPLLEIYQSRTPSCCRATTWKDLCVSGLKIYQLSQFVSTWFSWIYDFESLTIRMLS